MAFIIYCLTCSADGAKKYIGVTAQSLEGRWRSHVQAAGRKDGCPLIGAAILAHGAAAFAREVLEETGTLDAAALAETRWIKRLNCLAPHGYNVNLGGSISRGPLRHGHSPRAGVSPEYCVWQSMITRCTNPRRRCYSRYGGRGVGVADAWLGPGGFERFLADVGPRPSLGHTLDRWPQRNGNYEPGNVRWATRVQQARNKDNNRVVQYHGENITIAELAERTGVRYGLIRKRIEFGWDVELAVNRPPRCNPIEYLGETRTARDWARHFGLNVKTVEERLRRGWPIARALTETPAPALANRVPGINRVQRRRVERERKREAC